MDNHTRMCVRNQESLQRHTLINGSKILTEQNCRNNEGRLDSKISETVGKGLENLGHGEIPEMANSKVF